MKDLYHKYQMLKQTAEICPDENCKKIIFGWAAQLQELGYDNDAVEVDISEVELSGE